MNIHPENYSQFIKQDKEKIVQLVKTLQKSYIRDKGFVVIDRSWSVNVGFGPAPTEVLCDMLVMTRDAMPRMITVARERTNDVKQYNLNLAKKLKCALVGKGGCLECLGINCNICTSIYKSMHPNKYLYYFIALISKSMVQIIFERGGP